MELINISISEVYWWRLLIFWIVVNLLALLVFKKNKKKTFIKVNVGFVLLIIAVATSILFELRNNG